MRVATDKYPVLIRRWHILRRRPVVRPFFWAMFWATLAFVSWAAIRIGQMRPQPDAIASSVPGFLSRLVLRPLEAILYGGPSFDPGLVALQVGAAATISALSLQMRQRLTCLSR